MFLGLSNNGLNPYRQCAFLSGLRCEAVIPLEIQIPSLRVALTSKMSQGDNDRLRLHEHETLDEKWIHAQQHIELYQARNSKAFN